MSASASSHRILVTGARGFVGSWLTARLSSGMPAGTTVMAAHARSEGDGTSLDVTQTAEVADLVASFRPTSVVHLAAVSSLAEARLDARRTWDVNLFGTLNLAEAVMRHAPEARFVYASSSEIYGGSFNAAGGTLDESGLLDPRNPYAATKAAADLMLGQMAEAGLRSVRMRLFNHTGPGQTGRFVVPAFASQIVAAERGERPAAIKVGNLDARRDFLDVRDVVEAYVDAIEAPEITPGTIVNIASGTPRRIGNILDTLLKMSRIAITVELDPALMRPNDVPITAGNASRAAQLLGWRPTIPWETTLRDVLDHHRGRPA